MSDDKYKRDFERLYAELRELWQQGPRVARLGLKACATVFENSIRQAATLAEEPRMVGGHQITPGGEQASIGKTISRTATNGMVRGKVGLGVGKDQVDFSVQVTKGAGKAVSYGHFDILGTRKRWSGFRVKRKAKKGRKITFGFTGNPVQYRGVMRSNAYVRPAVEAVEDQALTAMIQKMDEAIKKIRNPGTK